MTKRDLPAYMIEDTPEWRVRKRLKTERKRRDWDQMDLARAANIKSKTTIVGLEKGRRMSEDTELAVEDVFGWKPGGLDRIRADKEPIPKDDVTRIPTPEELAEMPVAEVLRIIRHVRETQGDAAARQLKANFYGYMERATESKPEVQR